MRCVCTGDEVERGKPDPEIFRLAASRLGVDPARCVVIEDTPLGVRAAKAAGMRVVAVPSIAKRDDLYVDAGADVVLSSLYDLGASHRTPVPVRYDRVGVVHVDPLPDFPRARVSPPGGSLPRFQSRRAPLDASRLRF